MVISGLALGLRLLSRRFEVDRLSGTRFRMQIILPVSDLSSSSFYRVPPVTTNLSLFSYFSSVAPPAKLSDSKPFIVDYLVETFGLSETRALSASKCRLGTKDSKKPQSVILFLRQLGFSEVHVRNAVRVSPQILFADIEKTLKPKLQLFQDVGFTGSDLGRFISKNADVLNISLNRRLVPCMTILKNLLSLNDDHKRLRLVVTRCKWVLSKEPGARLLPNISVLKSHGIVGSQLSMLLVRQPALFLMRESVLMDRISRVLEMGFSVDSRMFAYALQTFGCMNRDTFKRKIEFLQGFGFTQEECLTMFKKTPFLSRSSEEKLKLGIEFFTNVLGFEKTVLVRRSSCLCYSLEKRTIPRYRVIEILNSKKLLRKKPSFLTFLDMPEAEFVDKFVSRFNDDVEELLMAYKGDMLDSSEECESA